MSTNRVVVVGAGIGGLASALLLAARGLEVVVLERASAPGGKMREVVVGESRLDAGPTVFTMRRVFDEIFEAAGLSFESRVTLRPLQRLARHAWDGGGRLDLFADMNRTAEAIGAFAGARDAQGYLDFCARSRRIYETLDRPFLRQSRPNPLSLATRMGAGALGGLWAISPFSTLWSALGGHFRDPRLRQLFGRYATYMGSSPFEAPATLMLIAHVEREGLWSVEGGMHSVARAFEQAATERGARFRYGAEVSEVIVRNGAVAGVKLHSGERIEAGQVVVNADVGALAHGHLGSALTHVVPAQPAARRSLSAVTWALSAECSGFALEHHNVFFSSDYAREFDDLFTRSRVPASPTVYVCAQDRAAGAVAAGTPERLFCLVNAPPTGDQPGFDDLEIASCRQRTFALLERCGLQLRRTSAPPAVTTPRDFERLFPGSGGALYGQASHGWQASFRRPGTRTRLPGLYLAGGSVHPGAGVPMAALSGSLAAQCLMADRDSTSRSHTVAMLGGISMR